MTRDEYAIKQECSKSLSESMLNAISYISSLEKRIAEIEQPKTCEGCKHFRPNTDDEYEHCALMINDCVRWYPEIPDYYEPLS